MLSPSKRESLRSTAGLALDEHAQRPVRRRLARLEHRLADACPHDPAGGAGLQRAQGSAQPFGDGDVVDGQEHRQAGRELLEGSVVSVIQPVESLQHERPPARRELEEQLGGLPPGRDRHVMAHPERGRPVEHRDARRGRVRGRPVTGEHHVRLDAVLTESPGMVEDDGKTARGGQVLHDERDAQVLVASTRLDRVKVPRPSCR